MTYSDILTNLQTVLDIQYPKSLLENYPLEDYYGDILTDSYFHDICYKDFLNRAFSAGFLFRVLTESSRNSQGIIQQMNFHASNNFISVAGLLVGRGLNDAAEMLKNAGDLAYQEFINLTYQPKRWQNESFDKLINDIILFFQVGYEIANYNLFD